jgi:hypothetical protein
MHSTVRAHLSLENGHFANNSSGFPALLPCFDALSSRFRERSAWTTGETAYHVLAAVSP